MKLERANPVHESASCWTNVEMCITCPANMHQKFAKKKKKKKYIYIYIEINKTDKYTWVFSAMSWESSLSSSFILSLQELCVPMLNNDQSSYFTKNK